MGMEAKITTGPPNPVLSRRDLGNGIKLTFPRGNPWKMELSLPRESISTDQQRAVEGFLRVKLMLEYELIGDAEQKSLERRLADRALYRFYQDMHETGLEEVADTLKRADFSPQTFVYDVEELQVQDGNIEK